MKTKNRLFFPLLSAALIALPTVSHADTTRFDVLYVYKLADGKRVAVAVPGAWREVSETRILNASSPALFLDESGRQFAVSAAELERAAAAKSVAWPDRAVKTKLAKR